MKKGISKIISAVLACASLVLLANISNGNISFSNKPDSITSATVKTKAATASMKGIDGNFIILINKNQNSTLKEYLSGDTSKRPENLTLGVAKNDEKAQKFIDDISAEKIVYDDALLMLSKAEYGDIKTIVMSKKTADTYTAKSLYDKDYIEVVELKGE